MGDTKDTDDACVSHGETPTATGKDFFDTYSAELFAGLSDANELVRESSVAILSDLVDARAINALIAALQDDSPRVRSQAAVGLGNFKDPHLLEPLRKLLCDNQAAEGRCEAAIALGRNGNAQVFDELVDALSDLDPDVRCGAARGLGYLKDKRAAGLLIEALRSPDGCLVEAAAEALGRIADEQAIQPLLELLKDNNESVRLKAAVALESFGNLAALGPFTELLAADGNANVRMVAARFLGQASDSKCATDALLAALTDPHPRVRSAAIRALKKKTDDFIRSFDVVAEEAEEGGYIVTCPALPGCISEGDTKEEALANIKDAIKGYLTSLRKHHTDQN